MIQIKNNAAATFLMVLTAACLSSCLGRIRGNGDMTTQQRQVAPFHEITLYGSMNVQVTRGSSRPVEILAESNLMPYIETEVVGDRLEIKTKPGIWLDPEKEITVHVTADEIREVDLAGSGNITGQNQLEDTGSIRFRLTGSGDLTFNLNCPVADADIAGSGEMVLSGQTRDLMVSITGSGDFHGSGLQSEQAEARILGSGNAEVNCSMLLKARIFGSGDVDYRGDPRTDVQVTGSGSVNHK